MSTFAFGSNVSKPIKIKIKKKPFETYIGTCRSYDKNQSRPSFHRSLSVKSFAELNTKTDDANKNRPQSTP